MWGGFRWAGGCRTSLKPPCSKHLRALPKGPSLHHPMSLAHGMWGWGAEGVPKGVGSPALLVPLAVIPPSVGKPSGKGGRAL